MRLENIWAGGASGKLSPVLAALGLVAMLGGAAAEAAGEGTEAASAPVVGRKLAALELQDFRGRSYSLRDFDGQRLLVAAFLGTECPLAKMYAPRLEELARKYAAQGVAFVGLMSNAHDSATEIATYAQRHRLEFPLLKDLGNQVADQLGATRTPEVMLLDEQRVVRFAGRIDDQYGMGVVRSAPSERYLEQALDELLQGKPVSRPVVEPIGCRIGRVAAPAAGAAVTYGRDIAPLLQRHCVACHREGEIAPFALTDYHEVAGWAETIGEVVEEGRMPPWHANPAYGQFRNENRLRDEEKRLLADWVRAGAPEGEAIEPPPPPASVRGWQLPREPDVVIPMSPEPFAVPATGEVRYQYFRVDPGFTEDKWLEAAELLPGNRAVVHHILVFARTGREEREEEGVRGFLVGYVPGLRVAPYPAGMAKRIPAGAQLVFQVHYTPIGSPQQDRSQLGLVFADPRTVTHEVITTSAVRRFFEIPPHAENHAVESNRRLGEDALLLAFMPHMHLRGKSFRYEAIFPTGEREILLDVPRYDFNWQTAYRLAEPRLLPAGTRVHCIAHFDNSEANLNNPDPTRTVTWGDQTWEEMMIGYFDIALPVTRATDERRDQRLRALEFLDNWDRDSNGALSKTEVPPMFQRIFSRVDTDGDGQLSEAELTEAVGRMRGRR